MLRLLMLEETVKVGDIRGDKDIKAAWRLWEKIKPLKHKTSLSSLKIDARHYRIYKIWRWWSKAGEISSNNSPYLLVKCSHWKKGILEEEVSFWWVYSDSFCRTHGWVTRKIGLFRVSEEFFMCYISRQQR